MKFLVRSDLEDRKPKETASLARGGGEQPEVKPQSAATANLIRPAVLASPRVNGEARMVSAWFLSIPDTRGPGEHDDIDRVTYKFSSL